MSTNKQTNIRRTDQSLYPLCALRAHGVINTRAKWGVLQHPRHPPWSAPAWGKVLNAALNCILKLRLWAFFWYPQLKTTLCSKWTVFLYPVTLLGLGFERSKPHHSNIGVNDHGLFSYSKSYHKYVRFIVVVSSD